MPSGSACEELYCSRKTVNKHYIRDREIFMRGLRLSVLQDGYQFSTGHLAEC